VQGGGGLRPARDMFVSALSKRIEMTLVKSLYSGDPDVIRNTRTCKWFRFTALARAIRPTSQFKSMYNATCTGAPM
jgi:hypothetical protein